MRRFWLLGVVLVFVSAVGSQEVKHAAGGMWSHLRLASLGTALHARQAG